MYVVQIAGYELCVGINETQYLSGSVCGADIAGCPETKIVFRVDESEMILLRKRVKFFCFAHIIVDDNDFVFIGSKAGIGKRGKPLRKKVGGFEIDDDEGKNR